jgi:hypothetical protein
MASFGRTFTRYLHWQGQGQVSGKTCRTKPPLSSENRRTRLRGERMAMIEMTIVQTLPEELNLFKAASSSSGALVRRVGAGYSTGASHGRRDEQEQNPR